MVENSCASLTLLQYFVQILLNSLCDVPENNILSKYETKTRKCYKSFAWKEL